MRNDFIKQYFFFLEKDFLFYILKKRRKKNKFKHILLGGMQSKDDHQFSLS